MIKTDTIRKNVKPLYDSDLESAASEALGRATGRDEFTFDPNTNALWGAYKRAYAREGARATADTLGRVSTMTGGTPSSYAVSAASQTANDYASKLSDKLPDVYNTELQKYYNDAALARQDYSTLAGARSQALSEAQAKASLGDYSALDRLGVDTANLREDRTYEVRQRALSDALTAAKYGDYSGLQNYGIDTSRYTADEDYKRSWDRASQIYELTGDSSGLEALGVNMDYVREQREASKRAAALEAAMTVYQATGDTSALDALGYDTSALREDRAYELSSRQAQLAAAQASAAKAAAETSSTSRYTPEEETKMNIKLKGGPAMWDESVREWAEYTYGVTPEQLYYVNMKNADSEYNYKKLAGDISLNQEKVKEILSEGGYDVKVKSKEEWSKWRMKNFPYTSYTDDDYQDYLWGLLKEYQ